MSGVATLRFHVGVIWEYVLDACVVIKFVTSVYSVDGLLLVGVYLLRVGIGLHQVIVIIMRGRAGRMCGMVWLSFVWIAVPCDVHVTTASAGSAEASSRVSCAVNATLPWK